MRPLTIWAAVAVAALSIGCDKTDSKTESEPKRKAGGSLLAPGSIEDLGKVGVPPAPAPGGNQGVQPQNAEPKFHERRVAGGNSKIFGVVTTKVVNYDVEMRKNPRLRIVRHKIDTSDPLSAYGSAYFTATAKLSMANFKHNLDIMAASSPNGRYPTYQQYVNLKKQFKVELVKRPPYQMYAYQEKTGTLVVLEDPDLKAKLQSK